MPNSPTDDRLIALVRESEAAVRETIPGLVDAVARAEAAIATAKEEIRAARAETSRMLRDYGRMALAAEIGRDRELIRFLYWEHPALHAADIALGFGLHANEVAAAAGPITETVPCARGCGCLLPRSFSSRTERVDWRGKMPRYCDADPCAAERAEEARLHRERNERAKRDRHDQLREAEEAGRVKVTEHREYYDEEGNLIY